MDSHKINIPIIRRASIGAPKVGKSCLINAKRASYDNKKLFNKFEDYRRFIGKDSPLDERFS